MVNTHTDTRIWKAMIIAGAATSIAGALISAALILEYFGVSIGATDALCTTRGGVNACRTVAKSAFAAIRGVPHVGDVPIALFGFALYGYLAFLFVSAFRRNTAGGLLPLRLSAALSSAACIVSIVLFLVSTFFIGAFCPLCTASYAAAALILLSSVIALRYARRTDPGARAAGMRRSLASFGRARLLLHSLVIILLIMLGTGIGLLARERLVESMSGFGGDERVSRLIARYEAVLDSRIELGGVPYDGSPGAPVRIVVYSDFNCSSCTRMNKSLKNLLKERPGELVVYYKNFPLGEQCRDPMDHRREASSCLAARAGVCAARQGKYGAMSAALYLDGEAGVEHDIGSLRSQAARLDLDTAIFESCMSSSESLERVREDRFEGERLMVDGTPTLFVNNRMLDTVDLDARTLRALIEYIRSKTKGGSP